MTLSEFNICVCALLGAIAGVLYGYSRYGLIGSASGFIVGLLAGIFTGSGLMISASHLGIMWAKWRQRRDLRKHFGQYYSKAKSDDWIKAKKDIQIGTSVEGSVVVKYHYGVFIDIGRGFPALLSKRYSDDATRELNPEIGTHITGRIREFDDAEHVFKLTQYVDDLKEEPNGSSKNRQ